VLVLLGCGTPAARVAVVAGDPSGGDDSARARAALYAELQDDVLTSYERDEPPDLDTAMIDPRIGTARIGAGPADVYLAGDLARAPSRWPLDVDRQIRTEVRSKRLELSIAADLTAAWTSDEVSWRIELCGRTAAIPLRITSLFARDGDRWVPVFEHLSFGQPAVASAAPPARPIRTEVSSGDLRDELSGVLGRGLLRHDPSVLAGDGFVLGPGLADEWRGSLVADARLPPGKLEDRRVGTVGRTPGDATVAYWVGTYVADVPGAAGVAAGKLRLRVTHVFEKRWVPATAPAKPGPRSCARDSVTKEIPADCHWQLVQTHMSAPITDDELTARVFGTALLSTKPLALDCADGGRVTTPAAALRPAASPPAARTR
jgi:hypothetical protein